MTDYYVIYNHTRPIKKIIKVKATDPEDAARLAAKNDAFSGEREFFVVEERCLMNVRLRKETTYIAVQEDEQSSEAGEGQGQRP